MCIETFCFAWTVSVLSECVLHGVNVFDVKRRYYDKTVGDYYSSPELADLYGDSVTYPVKDCGPCFGIPLLFDAGYGQLALYWGSISGRYVDSNPNLKVFDKQPSPFQWSGFSDLNAVGDDRISVSLSHSCSFEGDSDDLVPIFISSDRDRSILDRFGWYLHLHSDFDRRMFDTLTDDDVHVCFCCGDRAGRDGGSVRLLGNLDESYAGYHNSVVMRDQYSFADFVNIRLQDLVDASRQAYLVLDFASSSLGGWYDRHYTPDISGRDVDWKSLGIKSVMGHPLFSHTGERFSGENDVSNWLLGDVSGWFCLPMSLYRNYRFNSFGHTRSWFTKEIENGALGEIRSGCDVVRDMDGELISDHPFIRYDVPDLDSDSLEIRGISKSSLVDTSGVSIYGMLLFHGGRDDQLFPMALMGSGDFDMLIYESCEDHLMRARFGKSSGHLAFVGISDGNDELRDLLSADHERFSSEIGWFEQYCGRYVNKLPDMIDGTSISWMPVYLSGDELFDIYLTGKALSSGYDYVFGNDRNFAIPVEAAEMVARVREAQVQGIRPALFGELDIEQAGERARHVEESLHDAYDMLLDDDRENDALGLAKLRAGVKLRMESDGAFDKRYAEAKHEAEFIAMVQSAYRTRDSDMDAAARLRERQLEAAAEVYRGIVADIEGHYSSSLEQISDRYDKAVREAKARHINDIESAAVTDEQVDRAVRKSLDRLRDGFLDSIDDSIVATVSQMDETAKRQASITMDILD